MTLDELKFMKKKNGYTNAMLSELTGIPQGTLQKIFSGETKNPRYETRIALEKILTESSYPKNIKCRDGLVCEGAIDYQTRPVKSPGEYTLKDYYALPGDQRVELIDGVFFYMEAPSFIHQRFAFHFSHLVQNYISEHSGSCIPMVSPVDVRLNCDDKTIVQPDALILCDKSKIRHWGIDGAPDFILEVLSESTRKKDLSLKMRKYLNAGVKEYWILDPIKQMLYTYDFREEGVPGIYPLSGSAPVGIFGGDLKIDLGELAAFFADIPETP